MGGAREGGYLFDMGGIEKQTAAKVQTSTKEAISTKRTTLQEPIPKKGNQLARVDSVGSTLLSVIMIDDTICSKMSLQGWITSNFRRSSFQKWNLKTFLLHMNRYWINA